MIPGFDFTSVIARLGYTGGLVEVADVPGGYTHGQWAFDWDSAETRKLIGVALMPDSPKNDIEQSGNVENAISNLMVAGNIPMYAPSVQEFKHSSGGGDWQSFFKLHGRWYRVTGFDFIWPNTNCRSYNGVLFSEFNLNYRGEYQL